MVSSVSEKSFFDLITSDEMENFLDNAGKEIRDYGKDLKESLKTLKMKNIEKLVLDHQVVSSVVVIAFFILFVASLIFSFISIKNHRLFPIILFSTISAISGTIFIPQAIIIYNKRKVFTGLSLENIKDLFEKGAYPKSNLKKWSNRYSREIYSLFGS